MLKSLFKEKKEKDSPKIKKNGFYVFTKNMSAQGLGVLVLEIDDQIRGIKLLVNSTEKFQMKKIDFENLLIYDILNFVEVCPKDVVNHYKEILNS